MARGRGGARARGLVVGVGIRIVCCDKQTLVLAGVRAFLAHEPDMHIVRETQDIHETVRLALDLKPDVMLLGAPSQDVDLVGLVQRLRGAGGDNAPQVLIMASPEEEGGLLSALRAGARGVIGKDTSASDLSRAVRAVVGGQAALTPTMARRLLDWAMSAAPATVDVPPVARGLTGREREVMALVAKGLSDNEVAVTLGLSKATIRSHVHHLATKLGLSGRAQVIAFAYRYGLVNSDASDVEV
ncbi:DNA-binding response regulator, NarL/FixJ family, contains REC and HTH domains [Sinosporangium album]|uniref:DNA-binding response regulator, NarL/FixJ family, contains REC and HTH domains n=1 Tax=Sinosporangium album TaxID=504805 RepID=A0A1G8HJC3_9ACTN|nr:response regulator transcription factor [Sinosporangium album]SDI06797.1 DNA-binding response regulator, NarL/FixJ family, contains REC and HTH domains [Sinosporangium album]